MTPFELSEVGPVIPVVRLADAGLAVDVAGALADAGIRVIEVTLRTAAALDALAAIREARPDLLVGAGTVLAVEQARAAVDHGARFLVTPGTPDVLVDSIADLPVALLPGASTPTEMIALRARGFVAQKFFPAAASGGPAFLRAMSGPLPELRFCPTGGVDASSAPEYLRLSNVSCVGASWLVTADDLARRDWAAITARARDAMSRLGADEG